MSSTSESSGNDDDDGGIPFYLMPIAAICGMYTLYGSIRIMNILYKNITYKKETSAVEEQPTKILSGKFLVLIVTVILSVVGYAYVVASVDNAMAENEYALFDPYDILGVNESSNTTVIKKAYRDLSKIYHPDKSSEESSTKKFYQINLAYKALTEEPSKTNYQLYGHPDGPLQTQTLSFAMPDWLLNPKGNIALVLLLLYFSMFGFIIYVVIKNLTDSGKKSTSSRGIGSEGDDAANSVAGTDIQYLVSKIGPKSTHYEILFTIATTPENIYTSTKQIEQIEDFHKARIEQKQKEEEELKKSNKIDFDLDDGGDWGDDDDDDDNADNKEKIAEEKRQKERDQAKGKKPTMLLEGIDEKVIGQKWVESTLESKKLWPPTNIVPKSILEDEFTYNGKKVKALDHPAIKRNICMTMGRLNASLLNTHPTLLECGSQNLIDQTYFRASMDYRNKVGLLLEAILRIGISLKSYELTKTVLETVVMFKLGTMGPIDDPVKIKIFQDAMKKQYASDDGIPKLDVLEKDVETLGEDEIATNDTLTLTMKFIRRHAEKFTKFKSEAAAKQGIPPQVALAQYREGWWILVRAIKVGGGNDASSTNNIGQLEKENPVMYKLLMSDSDDDKSSSSSSADADAFKKTTKSNKFLITNDDELLKSAFPMIVQNCAQNGASMKLKFKAPTTPGKYKFVINIKSQEFLGSDEELVIEKTIVDSSTLEGSEDVDRGEEKKKEENDDKNDDTNNNDKEEKGDNDEPKKDK